MNAIFICVIVLVKMCFHMLNIFWFKHKKIFECFRCFWNVLCFYKNWKISKTVLPYFGDSVVGHPSRMLQTRARVLILATCSRVKGPVTKGTQRFLDSAHDFLVGRPSSHEKHLEIFFTILTLSLLAACLGDLLATHPSSEKRVFCVSKIVSLNFFSFSLEFLWLFTVFPILFLSNTLCLA